MIDVILVVREAGSITPDYSLHFALPEVPSVGSYVSIHRPDKPEPFSEDVVVRKVWWRLEHPETRASHSGEPRVGKAVEIFLECDIAEGPHSTDHWRGVVESARKRGVEVEEFQVARFSARESDFR